MEVRLLGPLRVVADDGSPVAVNGTKLRALLGHLAIDVGRVVPADQLFDDLYGEELPQSAANALQGLVSKLRRILGRPQAIVNRGGGYAARDRARLGRSRHVRSAVVGGARRPTAR